jgi:hypothetical protein
MHEEICFLPILSSRLIKETFCRSAVKFPSSLVKTLRRIGVETRLKGHRLFEIERDFFNKQGGKFPLHNIAFELFLDIVEWFDKDESLRNEIFAINSPIFWVREKVI